MKIITDSTCDLPQDLLERYQIGVLPVHINTGKHSYDDGRNFFTSDVFAHTDATGELCTTASPSIGEFSQCFAEESLRNDAVICITIGAGFSSCYQNACIAAGEFPNVYVVDSKNLSSGQGIVVLAAAEMAEIGLSPEKLCERLGDVANRVDASFILGQLDYMRKGGRCTSVETLGANILKLKPCIQVKNGVMRVTKKYRGPLEKVMVDYTRDRLSACPKARGTVFIVYPAEERQAIEATRQTLMEAGRFSRIVEAFAGGTVACHCGPGTIGVMFLAS